MTGPQRARQRCRAGQPPQKCWAAQQPMRRRTHLGVVDSHTTLSSQSGMPLQTVLPKHRRVCNQRESRAHPGVADSSSPTTRASTPQHPSLAAPAAAHPPGDGGLQLVAHLRGQRGTRRTEGTSGRAGRRALLPRGRQPRRQLRRPALLAAPLACHLSDGQQHAQALVLRDLAPGEGRAGRVGKGEGGWEGRRRRRRPAARQQWQWQPWPCAATHSAATLAAAPQSQRVRLPASRAPGFKPRQSTEPGQGPFIHPPCPACWS